MLHIQCTTEEPLFPLGNPTLNDRGFWPVDRRITGKSP